MTWLDLLCGLLLLLLGAGGYAQGFLRGLLRLVALLGGGAFGAALMLRMGTLGTAQATALWAAVAGIAGLLGIGLIFWTVLHAIPRFVHTSLPNRWLGVVPALVIGLVILALLLSFVERVALYPETQAFIRSGLLTGPLVEVVDLMEQIVAGVRYAR
jgi:uncharacterized membrane protein required for colicin V production